MAYGSVNVPGDLSGKQDLITGFPGQIVGIGADGKAAARDGWSSPNLLLNWDFRKPVNRNGKMEYTESGYTIDRFRQSFGTFDVGENSCKWVTSRNAVYKRFQQMLDFPFVAGENYTLSILAKVNTISGAATLRPTHVNGTVVENLFGTDIVNPTAGHEIYSYTFTTNANQDSVGVEILSRNSTNEYIDIDIKAWKLERGNHQTLAHRNEDGEWEIIDPPDYDLQYALCSQYSPITGEWVGSQHSNPNLLDNWYFTDPINQRGQTEYSINGYTIDRWRSMTISIIVSLVSGSRIRLTTNNPVAPYASIFAQFVENPKYFVGKTVTLSFLVGEISGSAIWQFAIRCAKSNVYVGAAIASLKTGLNSLIFLIPSTWDIDELSIQISRENAVPDDSIELLAAKLELGPIQTLAHKEGDTWVLNDPLPNKALELAKCQRYFIRIGNIWGDDKANVQSVVGMANATLNTFAVAHIALPITMRANPAVNAKNVTLRSALNDVTIETMTSYTVTNNGLYCGLDAASELTPGTSYIIRCINGGYIEFDANI